eukprot:6792407-Heterocapsa_arctica.AAC.1
MSRGRNQESTEAGNIQDREVEKGAGTGPAGKETQQGQKEERNKGAADDASRKGGIYFPAVRKADRRHRCDQRESGRTRLDT